MLTNGPRGPTRNLSNYLQPTLTPALRPRSPQRSLSPVPTANIYGTGSQHLPSVPSMTDGARSPNRSPRKLPWRRRCPERGSFLTRCLRRPSYRRWWWSVRPSRDPPTSFPRRYHRRRCCPVGHRRPGPSPGGVSCSACGYRRSSRSTPGLLHPSPTVSRSGRPRRGRPPALLGARRLPRRRRWCLGAHAVSYTHLTLPTIYSV